jgi:hypothetical protein
MLDPETLKSLTPSIVLLALVLVMGYAWVRDRNARIKDLKIQVTEWREAHRLSESARETQGEALREALEQSRTSEAVISGLRSALAQRIGPE